MINMEKSWFSTTFSRKEHKFEQSPVSKSLCGGPGFRERSPHVPLKKKRHPRSDALRKVKERVSLHPRRPPPKPAELSAKKGLLARDSSHRGSECASAQLPQLCRPPPNGPRVPRCAVQETQREENSGQGSRRVSKGHRPY